MRGKRAGRRLATAFSLGGNHPELPLDFRPQQTIVGAETEIALTLLEPFANLSSESQLQEAWSE